MELAKIWKSLNWSRPEKLNSYVALFDYESRSDTDLSIRKGDLMKIFDDKVEGDWQKVQTSKGTGFVPSVYIAKAGSLQSKE